MIVMMILMMVGMMMTMTAMTSTMIPRHCSRRLLHSLDHDLTRHAVWVIPDKIELVSKDRKTVILLMAC